MKNTVETIEHAKCYHCGDVCNKEHIVFDEKDFCCNGCQTVYEILRDHDLCTYYDLDKNPGISLKSKNFRDKFAYLENEEIARMLTNFSDGNKSRVTLYLPAIHCSSCIWLLENLYKLHEGIENSRVHFVKKEIILEYLNDKLNLRQVVELLASIGYEPYISLQEENKKPSSSVNKSLIIKIGVAGFCFGNIMLLSFPEYFGFSGLEDQFIQQFILYLNLLLSLPVLFYCASDYFKSAYEGLRHKYISIDVPISLGILALFSRSLYEVVAGIGPGYLDSLAGLIFFLLVGRWFQNFTYEGLSFERDYKSYFPLAISKKINGEWQSIPVNQLVKDDIICIRNQEVIPADGWLLSDKARIDYSFVTGESEPVEKFQNDYIYAGGKQAGSNIDLKVAKPVSQSYLTQLWNNEVFDKEDDSQIQHIVNRVSKYFTLLVVAIAAASFVFWYPFDVSTAFHVFTAVLIIACPCALALSTPFTLGNVMRIFGKVGFYLKNTAIIEKMAAVKHVVFDKTGTLTLNQSQQIGFEGSGLAKGDEQLIASLVCNSTHPLSRQIFDHLEYSDQLNHVYDFEEVPGKGLEGKVNGRKVILGSAAFVMNGLASDFHAGKEQTTLIYIKIDNHYKGRFTINNKYRDGLPALINALTPLLKMSLLTGDDAKDEPWLRKVFPVGSHFLFSQKPDDKLGYIRKCQEQTGKVMMIGDGLNDAGALKQSDVGVSVSEKSSNFTPASDAILDSRAFGKFHKLFLFSKTAMKIIMASFVISFLYNIAGLSFAVSGNLSPLIAAILMPLSSITIVAFATISVNISARIKGVL